MRCLIDSIDLVPTEEGVKKMLALSLRGKLAAILALGAGIKTTRRERLWDEGHQVDRGVGFVICDFFSIPAPNTKRLGTMHY